MFRALLCPSSGARNYRIPSDLMTFHYSVWQHQEPPPPPPPALLPSCRLRSNWEDKFKVPCGKPIFAIDDLSKLNHYIPQHTTSKGPRQSATKSNILLVTLLQTNVPVCTFAVRGHSLKIFSDTITTLLEHYTHTHTHTHTHSTLRLENQGNFLS